MASYLRGQAEVEVKGGGGSWRPCGSPASISMAPMAKTGATTWTTRAPVRSTRLSYGEAQAIIAELKESEDGVGYEVAE